MDFIKIFYVLIILYVDLHNGVFGKINRIIGGEPADIKEFPYMVSIRNSQTDYHFCGGVIISHLHILTAGHCLSDKKKYYDKIFLYTGSTTPGPTSGQAHRIAKVDIHPAFEATDFSSHDLAIITVKNSIKFNKYQKKANLPIRNIREGESALLAGWGTVKYPSYDFSPRLQKAPMIVMAEAKCHAHFRDPLTKQQFCAFQRKGIGSCNGDSGGPLIVKGKLAGILSGNIPCAVGFPDVYINVFDYLGYIKYIIEK